MLAIMSNKNFLFLFSSFVLTSCSGLFHWQKMEMMVLDLVRELRSQWLRINVRKTKVMRGCWSYPTLALTFKVATCDPWKLILQQQVCWWAGEPGHGNKHKWPTRNETQRETPNKRTRSDDNDTNCHTDNKDNKDEDDERTWTWMCV